jgi:hypothetical protein
MAGRPTKDSIEVEKKILQILSDGKWRNTYELHFRVFNISEFNIKKYNQIRYILRNSLANKIEKKESEKGSKDFYRLKR